MTYMRPVSTPLERDYKFSITKKATPEFVAMQWHLEKHQWIDFPSHRKFIAVLLGAEPLPSLAAGRTFFVPMMVDEPYAANSPIVNLWPHYVEVSARGWVVAESDIPPEMEPRYQELFKLARLTEAEAAELDAIRQSGCVELPVNLLLQLVVDLAKRGRAISGSYGARHALEAAGIDPRLFSGAPDRLQN